MSDESKIRELSESIRTKCLQVQQQQVNTTTPGNRQQQNPPSSVTTSAAHAQSSEVRSRLKDVIVRLQEGIQDPTLSGVQQRLQYTATKYGLTYSNQRSTTNPSTTTTGNTNSTNTNSTTSSGNTNSTGICCYLSSESFYIEVCLDDNGTVQTANVVLGQETQQNTQLLVELLQQYKYEEFEKHVKSLVDMFSQATGQEVSLLLLRVIFAMENILLSINNNSKMNPFEAILLNHLGLVTPRKAGLPMKLTFFVTPLEALKGELPQSNTDPSIGISAEVQVERSTQLYRLPADPNLFNRSQSSFNNVTEQNSVSVPLTLILCLNEDIPVCAGITEQLQQTMYGSGQSLPPLTTPHVDQLILMEESRKRDSFNKDTATHVIYLPGQVHEYTGIGGGGDQTRDVPNAYRGVLLPNRKVPFTHPMHVITIIRLLRQQLVYNTLLKSCLERRKNSSSLAKMSNLKQFSDYSFHVTTQPPELIAMTTRLLAPKESALTLKIEFLITLTNVPTQPIVQLTLNDTKEQSRVLSGILTKCMSIPVTLHTMLSNPSKLLPPSFAAAVKDHHDTLTQFNHDLLTSCDSLTQNIDSSMEIGQHEQLVGQLSVVGNKRKRALV